MSTQLGKIPYIDWDLPGGLLDLVEILRNYEFLYEKTGC